MQGILLAANKIHSGNNSRKVFMNKKRILIVNCFSNEWRIPFFQSGSFSPAMAPTFLAGLFSPDLCDIRLYNEQSSGPLRDEELLAWPDMLVLTGLNTAFDRMLHLTAYARTQNSKVIVVAGGSAIRALFHYAQAYFDYCCDGDIEQMQYVIEDAFGKQYVSEQFLRDGWAIPRYDLLSGNWTKNFGYVESSRNCYHRCSFCTTTAEKTRYRSYDLEYLKQQILALGKKKALIFIDNNFSSFDKQFISDRFALLKELRQHGYFTRWAASVSADFFLNDENISQARETGCMALFTGLETFDRQSLINFNKHQNTIQSQVEMIRKCLTAGIMFYYGIVFDIANRAVANLHDEIDYIVDTPAITLPCYMTLAIPILGTPFFQECLEKHLILPNVKIRDLDAFTITLKPQDPHSEVAAFAKNLSRLGGYRGRVINHARYFFAEYRKEIPPRTMMMALYNSWQLCAPWPAAIRLSEAGSLANKNLRPGKRTFIGPTEAPDYLYTPTMPIDPRYRHYFNPTMLTDSEGNLSEALRQDLSPTNRRLYT